MSVAKINNIGGSGGVKLVDINPTKVSTGVVEGYLDLFNHSGWIYNVIPVCGYDKVALRLNTSTNSTVAKFTVMYKDGTESEEVSIPLNSWTNYISLENAVCIKIADKCNQNYNQCIIYYSLLTKESPYNPDNA